jgi:hypothetical protein
MEDPSIFPEPTEYNLDSLKSDVSGKPNSRVGKSCLIDAKRSTGTPPIIITIKNVLLYHHILLHGSSDYTEGFSII